MIKNLCFAALIALALFGCQAQQKSDQTASGNEAEPKATDQSQSSFDAALNKKYTEFKLTADLSHLSDNQKAMLPILIEISDIMDELFWLQSYGPKQSFLAGIADPQARRFAEINYGPWDRLNNNSPFLEGASAKAPGANFYPKDITKEEIEAAKNPEITSLYTLVSRDGEGMLTTTPYHVAYKEQIAKAAEKLRQASTLADDEGFKKYLSLRADAFLNDEYLASDLAWMDMKTNMIDFVVGPIEVYEDELMGAKAAHEAYVLLKDMAWSKRLERYTALLPELQKSLPVADAYKAESPGSDSDLNAYDVIYYAGHCNAGSKTIAINLPNDEKVQLEKGTRRLQLKNAMRAKFDHILVPIGEQLIVPEQRKHITFDAFFSNTMFHEVAHGLGIKNTINGKGTVRAALSEKSSALEEGKADVLGLYMVTKLLEKNEIQGDVKDYYVTFIASIFRSIRFGGSSAHGRANLLRFNFFQEMGAFSRNAETGLYQINFDKVPVAMIALTQKILTFQGDGDYDGVTAIMNEKGQMNDTLKADLGKLSKANIPVDITFEQGTKALGL